MKNLKTLLTIFFLLAVVCGSNAQVAQRWASRYNGSGNNIDAMSDMIVDNNGNAFVCGFAYRSQTNTNDAMVIKYDSTGAQIWAAVYNGASNGGDYAAGIAMDNSGNVYIVGRSQSASGFDIITLKFNSAGALVWERRIDGSAHGDDFGRDITIDAAGNICITGDADLGLFSNSNDIIIAKYDTNGNLLFTIYNYNFSGSAIDIPYSITTDASNNIYVTGTWGSDNGFGGVNSQITTLSLSPSGTLRWAKQYGDPINLPIEAYDIKCDFAGNVLVTGKVQSTATGHYQSATIKYNSANGNVIWANRFTASGSAEDITRRIAIDDSNNVYVTGYNIRTTNRDQIVLKYTPSGSLSWGVSYNQPTYNLAEEGQDIMIRGRWIYTCGSVTGPTQKDYLVLKYDRFTGAELWGKSYFGPSSGDDGAFRIGLDAVQNVYAGGNSYGGSTTNFDWATVKFIQTPPAAPTLITPANGATNVSITPVLDWSDVTGADTYQLQVSTSSAFTTNVISIGTLTSSTYSVPAGVLSANTLYYWRVTALNEFGFSAIAGPRTFTTGGVTGIEPIGADIPKEFKLYDNYPNPFNPSTKIKFDIASAGDVNLVVYDLLGRAVTTIIDQKLSAGVYEVSFDGSSLASGVYFFRLNAGSYTNIKKMILTK